MIKCPFCGFENEDGALFCEQCKSDLGGAIEPIAMAAGMEAVPAMAMPVDEAPIPMAGAVEAAPILEAAPMVAEAVPAAAPAPAPAAPAAPAAASAPAPAAPAAPGAAPPPLAADAQPRLVVMRGQKLNVEFPIYEGHNFIGRADEKPVDIDLEDQEPPDRIWSSRQHALITFENGALVLEDLNSSNGTFVNRTRVYPGQKRPLAVNDVVQIGTVQLKLKA